MKKEYKYILVTLLLVCVVFFPGCGTTSSFRSAKLATSDGFDTTLGVSVHSLTIKEEPIDGYPPALQHSITRFIRYRPEISISKRLGSESSRWDAGINSAFIPFPMNSYVLRRSVLEQDESIPMTTIGIMYRQVLLDRFDADELWPYPLKSYTDEESLSHQYDYYEFVDMGIPVYMTWNSRYQWVNDLNVMAMPFIRAIDADSDFPGRYGLQLAIGLNIQNIIPEVSIIYSKDDSLHAQLGIAYKP